MLKIDSSIIWIIVNLLIFYFLIRKFLFKRVLDMIEKRKQLIDSQFAEAQSRQDAADALKKQYEDSLSNAKEESIQIVEDAKTRGQAEYDMIVKEAHDESQRILNRSNETIEHQRKKTMEEIQGQIGDLAMAAAAKIIGDSANGQTDSALYDEFLKKTGDQDDTDSE